MSKKDDGCCASSAANLEIILEQPLVVPVKEIVAHTALMYFPPGDIGLNPNFHPGPVVGYVIEGEYLFQVNDEKPQIISAGSAFYEKHGDIHVWSANASDTKPCKVTATVFGNPHEPVTTYVKNYARVTRAEALAVAVKEPQNS